MMRRLAIGLAVGVAVFVGSAVAAEAQVIQIDPIGPTSVTAGQTGTQYQANVTPNSTNLYYIQVSVYVNGVYRFTTSQNSYITIGTKLYKKNISLTSLNLQAGDQINFKCQAGWSSTNLPYTADWIRTVGS